MRIRSGTSVILTVVGWLAFASPVMSLPETAQYRSDSRWWPWLGCWQLAADVTQASGHTNEDEAPLPAERLVCVVSAAEGAAEVRTYVDRELLLQETLYADGVPRPVDESGCRGHQLTQWSRDGARLFFRSEMTCENQSRRSFSGVSFMRASGTWVDVQALVSGAEREIVIRRYRPASPEAAVELGLESSPGEAAVVSTARAIAALPFDIDAVIEASEIIEPEALEAALMESGTTLELNSKTLVMLADCGVSPRTIDLMVAIAYPEQFEIYRDTSGGYADSGGRYEDWDIYYFAPFGYYYWYTPYRSFFVHHPPVPDRGISGGKLVKGRGYTRVDPNRTVRGDGQDGSTGGSSSSSSHSSGGSSTSSDGYSRGSSTSSRTAKPRDP